MSLRGCVKSALCTQFNLGDVYNPHTVFIVYFGGYVQNIIIYTMHHRGDVQSVHTVHSEVSRLLSIRTRCTQCIREGVYNLYTVYTEVFGGYVQLVHTKHNILCVFTRL